MIDLEAWDCDACPQTTGKLLPSGQCKQLLAQLVLSDLKEKTRDIICIIHCKTKIPTLQAYFSYPNPAEALIII